MKVNWHDCISINVPEWLLLAQNKLQSKKYLDDEAKMELVFECAARNAKERSGAPLAAAIFWHDGSLISIGVDTAGIGGHEMTNSLLVASNLLGHQTLRSTQNWDLFSLAPPCLICQGNIFSERPQRFVCAINHDQLLAELALPNTPFPDFDWIEQLNSRGIIVESAIAPEKGLNVLRGQRKLR